MKIGIEILLKREFTNNNDLMDSPIINIEHCLVYIMSSTPVIRPLQSECKGLVVYTAKESTRQMRLSKFSRDNTIFPKNVISQLVGHLLGDGAMRINRTSSNPYFYFGQSFHKLDYLLHVYDNLTHYCMQIPAFKSVIRNNTVDYSMLLATRNYAWMHILYSLFYKRTENDKIVKIIT